MPYLSSGTTHPGLIRELNEDYFYHDDYLGLYIVADGLGGHTAGEVASKIAVESIIDSVKDSHLNTPEVRMDLAFREASESILEHIKVNPDHMSMASTAVAILVEGSKVTIAHVGDSRSYVLRDKKIKQLTIDHTWVQTQFEKGLLSEKEISSHPMRNVITQALGNTTSIRVEITSFTASTGDRFLLCSDGLNGMIDEKTIEQTLGIENQSECLSQLILAALREGGADNITAVLIDAI
jgi:serine/threonine protein phosphatase PrpC